MKGGMKTHKKTSEKTSMATGKEISLTKRQRELICLLIEDNSVSIDEITEMLKINRSAVQKHFEALKSKGYIRRMGPDKGGFWEVLITL